jgi:hypothetical protein
VDDLPCQAELARVLDVLPDDGGDAPRPVSEMDLEVFATIAALPNLDIADEQWLGYLTPVDKLPYLHANEDKVAPGWTKLLL